MCWQRTLLCKPFMPDIPCASWNEWIRIRDWSAMVLNSSWMLSRTSLFTSSVLMIFLLASCSARRARFDAISPHPTYALPR
jgi:hypothetical protein